MATQPQGTEQMNIVWYHFPLHHHDFVRLVDKGLTFLLVHSLLVNVKSEWSAGGS